jgi:hypothetical protein
MKYLLFPFLLLLSGCAVYNQYTLASHTSTNHNDSNRLTDIPLNSHKNKIEVFFGDEKPKEKYIKAFLLEEIAYGEVSYGILVNRLKVQAQKKGVDALIILSRDRNISETEFSYTVTNTASALGVKYVKNLKFEEGIPKQAVLSIFDKQKAVYVPNEQFLLNNYAQIKHFEQSNLYLKNFHHYSLDFMLHEINYNWQAQTKLESPNQIYKRQYRTSNKTITFTFTYNKEGKVIHVLRHHYLGDVSVKIEIEFEYKDGKISKSKIYQKTGHREVFRDEKGFKLNRIHKRTEVYEYQSDGKLLRRTLFQISNNKPKPFMKFSYEYYTEKEYAEIVKKAQ